jgi:DNA-binding MarR family transcriptional regulator
MSRAVQAEAAEVPDSQVPLRQMFKLARSLRTAVDRELLPYGITSQQAALMLVARMHGGRSPHHFAGPLGTDTAGMTRLVDRLEAKGLVLRQSMETDRRAVRIDLTEAGEALTPNLVAAFERVSAQLLDGFAESEVEQLRSFMHRLLANLRCAELAASTASEQPC